MSSLVYRCLEAYWPERHNQLERTGRLEVRALLVSVYPRSAEAKELKEKRTEIRDQRSDDAVVASSAPSAGDHYRKPAVAAPVAPRRLLLQLPASISHHQ